jgi:hypothetical protein
MAPFKTGRSGPNYRERLRRTPQHIIARAI